MSFSNSEREGSPGHLQPHRLFLTATALAALGLIILLYLAQQSQTKIIEFRSSQLDNSTWIVAQLEVDHLKLQRAVLASLLTAEQNGDYRPSSTALLAFDIYYSRVQVLSARFSTLSEFTGLNDIFKQRWQVVVTDLEQMANIFDNTSKWTPAQLKGLAAQLERHGDNVRQITVLALKHITTVSSERFDTNMSMARSFAIVAMFMVVVLGIIIAISGKLASDLAERTRRLTRVTTTLNRTFNASLDAIVLMDATGEIISCNNGAEKLFGRNREWMVGRDSSLLLVPARFTEEFRKEFARLGELSRTSLLDRGPMRIPCSREDGSEFIAEVVSVPEIDGQGKPIVISFFRDVSKQAQTEQLLRKAKHEAERLARNKERFLAVVSHELRTPLHGISAALELMSSPDYRQDDLQELLATAQVSATSAREILDEVLEATEVSVATNMNRLDTFDPTALLSEIIAQVQPVAMLKQTNIVVQNNWTRERKVLSNRKAFRHALTNLLRNATKFTSKGTVVVRLGESETNVGHMRIEVEDTGPGISQKDQQRIFEDFETAEQDTTSDISGTGLGLGIFKRAVEALGGHFGLQSKEGWGSLFWFEFPYIRANHSVPEPLKPVMLKPITKKHKILVVDDNNVNRFVISKMLRKLGQHAELAESGALAVEMCARTRFDIVLMDLNMPGMNGRECAALLRQGGMSSDARIVAVTANLGTANAATGSAADLTVLGFETVLLKPFSLTDLQALLISPPPSRQAIDEVATIQNDPASEEEYAFDQSVLANLQDLEAMLGKDQTQRIVRRAFEDADTAMRAVKDSGLPAATAADNVHSAIASLGMVGAQELYELFQRLENALRADDSNAVDATVCEVEVELQKSTAMFRSFFPLRAKSENEVRGAEN